MVEEHWIEDLEEFEPSPQESPSGPKNRSRWARFQKGNLPYLLLGIGAILLLLIVFAGLLGGDDQQEQEQNRLDQMAATLTRMQDRLEGLEARQEKLLDRMADLEPEYKFDTLFQNLNTLSNELEQVEKELQSDYAALQKKLAGAGGGSGGSSSGGGRSGSATSGQVHVVQQGDNLYRIGLQYDVSIEQLRQWNDLEQGELLQPGQELIVSP